MTSRGLRFLTDRPQTPTSPGTLFVEEAMLFPQPNDIQVKLYQRCRTARLLSMHPIGKFNLLCYDRLGVYINAENGKLIGTTCIEWECQPAVSVLWRPPHFILVSTNCLEIRDMATGSLLQLLVGAPEQKLICDGRGISEDLERFGVLLASSNNDGRETMWCLSPVR